MPLHFRGAVTAVLDWLESLPTAVLDDRPSLWWRYASLLLVTGQTTGVEEKLQAAEAALRAQRSAEADDKTRNLVGRIAAAKAMGLVPVGVLGVLLRAKRMGNLDSVVTAMRALQDQAGFFINPDLFASLAREAGEH